jgi:hypothetical protein
MKNLAKISILVLSITVMSCKDGKSNNEVENNATEMNGTNSDEQLYSCSMHPEVTGKKGESCSKCGMDLTEKVVATPAVEEIKEMDVTKSNSGVSIDMILDNYFTVKNALANDDSAAAANASKNLEATLQKTATDKVEADLLAQYKTIFDAAQSHTASVRENSGKIALQRSSFSLLSADIHNITKMFETDKNLYQDYCPMYNQGKNGYWISEFKEIKNPYYGSEMLTCGGITKEW